MNVAIYVGYLEPFFILSDEPDGDDMTYELPDDFYHEYRLAMEKMQYYQDVFNELVAQRQREMLTGKQVVKQ